VRRLAVVTLFLLLQSFRRSCLFTEENKKRCWCAINE